MLHRREQLVYYFAILVELVERTTSLIRANI